MVRQADFHSVDPGSSPGRFTKQFRLSSMVENYDRVSSLSVRSVKTPTRLRIMRGDVPSILIEFTEMVC